MSAIDRRYNPSETKLHHLNSPSHCILAITRIALLAHALLSFFRAIRNTQRTRCLRGVTNELLDKCIDEVRSSHEDLDYHLIRSSIVIIFLFFGYHEMV